MIKNIYVERSIINNDSTKSILKKIKPQSVIECDNYQEVFNSRSQNFKLQKIQPALILAKKNGNLLTKIPEKFGIGGYENYYFSHMLNCIYDCRYCFLQGMYSSANYVLFLNFDDFKKEIKKISYTSSSPSIHFFSGYDCDSLAFEPTTNFLSNFLENLELPKKVLIELRTKSTQINFLLKKKSINNIIVAYSLNPDVLVRNIEIKTPTLKKRIRSLKKLGEKGWKIGLRFDPIIICEDFEKIYSKFFNYVFRNLEGINVHSITLGSFRMPSSFLKKIQKLYPNEKLLFSNFLEEKKITTYSSEFNEKAIIFCKREITKYWKEDLIFINS